MKKIWAVRKDTEAVSPVIATILMVAITVVLAAVLYVMVLGFGGTQTTTPAATYQKTTDATTNGAKITIVSITKTDVSWNDITIQLSDGTNFAEWEPVATNLDGGSAVSSNLSGDALGSLTVYCQAFDVSGNGYVSGSDYFVLWATTFSSATQYTAVLVYDVTGEKIGTGAVFTG